MKRLAIITTLVLAGAVLAPTAQAALYTETYSSGFANGGVIPDGTSGWWDTRNVNNIPSGLVIGGVTVAFTISGGYNGDLTAYLSHNGVLVPLLNRVGTGSGGEPQNSFGFSTAGFNNITLDDQATANIHDVQNPISGQSYLPDGGTLGNFTGNPNGNWTIFFADLSGGGGSGPSTLTSWGLEITAVPEPVNVALGIFAGVFVVVVVGRSRLVRNRVQRWRDAAVQWIDAV